MWQKMLMCALLSIGSCLTYAQSSDVNADSLWQVWTNTKMQDSSRMKALDHYINAKFLYTSPDSTLFYANEMMQLAKKKKQNKYIAIAYNNLGIANWFLGKMDEAISNFNEVKRIAAKEGLKKIKAGAIINTASIYAAMGEKDTALIIYQEGIDYCKRIKDEEFMVNAMINAGNIYMDRGHYMKAIEYFSDAIKIAKRIDNRVAIASGQGNLGFVYMKQGLIPQALDYMNQALIIHQEMGNAHGEAFALNFIGSAYNQLNDEDKAMKYFKLSYDVAHKTQNMEAEAIALVNMGNIHADRKEFEQAEKKLLKALEIRKITQNPDGMSGTLTALGGLFLDQDKREEAIAYYNEALAITRDIKDLENEAQILTNLAQVDFKYGQFKSCIDMSNLAMKIAQQVGKIEIIRNLADQMYKSYKALNLTTKALEMHELFHQMSDSIDSEENKNALLQHEFKLAYEKRALTDSLEYQKKEAVTSLKLQKQELSLSRQRIALFSSIGIVLLLGALGYSIYKGKKRSDELLLNILPSATAKELKKHGQAESRHYERVTVLFTDFKGFTSISEKLSPTEVVNAINECFSEFDRITEKYGIEKIKTIGDAYMAAGGLPVPDYENATRVVNAALEMQAFIAKLKSLKGENAFDMRVGINTGAVVAGIVGVKKFQYDIWGDTVNTAARMESNGEIGKVNISESTYDLIKEDKSFHFIARGKIEAKGKGEIEMYFVEKVTV